MPSDASKFLTWALDRKGREHVFFPMFVSHFALSDRESASRHFQDLIQSTLIDRRRRKKLQESYKHFQEHNEEQFWTKHLLRINTRLSGQKLARAAQDTATDEAEAAYWERRKEIAEASSSTTSTTGPKKRIVLRKKATVGISGPAHKKKQRQKRLIIETTERSDFFSLDGEDETPLSFDNDEAASPSKEAMQYSGEIGNSKGAVTATSFKTSIPSKRSAADVAHEFEEFGGEPSSRKPVHKRVAFLEADFFSESGSDYICSAPSSARSSLNSTDFLFIDHLIGPGTTSSQLTTNERIIFNGVDVSLLLMSARRSLIKKRNEIKDVSDLLTINFIFDEIFLKRHFPKNLSTFFFSRPSLIPMPSDGETKLICDSAVFSATHSFLETKKYVQSKIGADGESLAAVVLRHYTDRPYLWLQTTSSPTPSSILAQNEDSFTQGVVRNIILGLVRDLEVIDHWSRDPLPTPNGFEELYFPDYFAEFEGLPLFLVEIKKPGIKDIKDINLEGDQRKLPCMLKIILDNLLGAGVLVHSVIGLLIKSARCEVYTMSLDYESLYIYKQVGVFELPMNNLQLGLLCAAAAPLNFAHDKVKRTVDSIKANGRGPSEKDTLRRPSYYVKGNLVPAKACVAQDSVSQA